MSTWNGYSLLAASNLLHRDREQKFRSKFLNHMTVMARHGPSPLPLSLRLGLAAYQPSKRHHAQSLLVPSCHHPRTPHVLKFHPK